MPHPIDVALLVGWQEDPFYYYADDPEEYGHSIDEAQEDLQLPAALVADIKTWDAQYQATYDPDGYVWSKSGFASPEIEAAWRERGKELAARLKQESPVVASVNYRANGVIPDKTCMF
ncbi:hypothetical protein [Actinoalloteichus hymeniacidonis]|uniref:Uncharacterized protein n=1 Tax=Actinoalloteichus hymeniacidonis TaxID=340345 RepID=A0AAC9HP98_9PSEU|nr:hypothetical protein [Actinoalloteichus hymeniacidonis]AOS62045.1 hypothetical protein TL08_06100 [Actinoalloteichus hymeniacidonis]MBB5909933.1 hypothetical protein [Actinoalloteichus hymeniacidonis]